MPISSSHLVTSVRYRWASSTSRDVAFLYCRESIPLGAVIVLLLRAQRMMSCSSDISTPDSKSQSTWAACCTAAACFCTRALYT
eukprot:CAMPEP_0202905882 /NCGR_PEP_ID=MMETSP1392-20130828/36463_1 /ASSEMBLY_ACC=CAM_ASM_000868 /TAXON_ID=225041 /ORGANISM="Chlamydomonas chlamydogama, Strain SAG 11-48b" /LENGTH=83 /DNA_ID=CAMNT_0049594179 /DNA_START=639 /DNA_END=890 /DNA_ORIENTATION=-